MTWSKLLGADELALPAAALILARIARCLHDAVDGDELLDDDLSHRMLFLFTLWVGRVGGSRQDGVERELPTLRGEFWIDRGGEGVDAHADWGPDAVALEAQTEAIRVAVITTVA